MSSARIFSKGASAPAENLIARSKLRHVLADRLDSTRQIESRDVVPWPERPGRNAHDVRRASQQVPVANIDGRCLNANQHLIVACDRPLDVLEFQTSGRPYLSLGRLPSSCPEPSPRGGLIRVPDLAES